MVAPPTWRHSVIQAETAVLFLIESNVILADALHSQRRHSVVSLSLHRRCNLQYHIKRLSVKTCTRLCDGVDSQTKYVINSATKYVQLTDTWLDDVITSGCCFRFRCSVSPLLLPQNMTSTTSSSRIWRRIWWSLYAGQTAEVIH